MNIFFDRCVHVSTGLEIASLYVGVYACMCVHCIHKCMHVSTRLESEGRMHAYMYVYIYIYIHTYIYAEHISMQMRPCVHMVEARVIDAYMPTIFIRVFECIHECTNLCTK